MQRYNSIKNKKQLIGLLKRELYQQFIRVFIFMSMHNFFENATNFIIIDYVDSLISL